jgi:DHA1 family tetracycline resistance protein-like MFS transporter
MLGYSLTLPLLPTITKTFTSSDIMVGIITSANAVFSMIFGPIWGKLSDKHGRKPILFISQAGTLVAFVLLASSASIEMILFARILDGVFSGQHPVIIDNRAEKISKMMVFVSLSTLIGPLLGGLLGAINWRIPPIFTSVLSMISILLTAKLLIETMPRERREEIQRQRQQKGTPSSKSRVLNPLMRIRLVQVFTINAVFTVFTSSMALVVGDRYQQGPAVIGILLSFMFVMLAVFGGVLMVPLRKKLGDLVLTFVAVGSGIIAWIVFVISANIWLFLVFLVFLIFFEAILQPMLKANLTKTVDRSKQGEIGGWTTTVQSLAQSIVPVISTGFLEIGQLVLLGVVVEPYTLIGMFSIALLTVLGLILFKDARKDPGAFKFNQAELDHLRNKHRHRSKDGGDSIEASPIDGKIG